jgi:hypothetical protein
MEKKQTQILIKKCPKCKEHYYADFFCEKCGLCYNCCECNEIPIVEEGFTNFYIEEE